MTISGQSSIRQKEQRASHGSIQRQHPHPPTHPALPFYSHLHSPDSSPRTEAGCWHTTLRPQPLGGSRSYGGTWETAAWKSGWPRWCRPQTSCRRNNDPGCCSVVILRKSGKGPITCSLSAPGTCRFEVALVSMLHVQHTLSLQLLRTRHAEHTANAGRAEARRGWGWGLRIPSAMGRRNQDGIEGVRACAAFVCCVCVCAYVFVCEVISVCLCVRVHVCM